MLPRKMRSCVAGVCVLVAVSVVRLAACFEMTLLHVNDIHVKMEETNKYSSTCKPRDRGRTHFCNWLSTLIHLGSCG